MNRAVIALKEEAKKQKLGVKQYSCGMYYVIDVIGNKHGPFTSYGVRCFLSGYGTGRR